MGVGRVLQLDPELAQKLLSSNPTERHSLIYFIRNDISSINLFIGHLQELKSPSESLALDKTACTWESVVNLVFVPNRSLVCERMLEESGLYAGKHI